MKLNWNFLGGGGHKTKKPSVGESMDIFCNCTFNTCTFSAVFIEIGGRGALFDCLDNVLMFVEWLRISAASEGSCALSR